MADNKCLSETKLKNVVGGIQENDNEELKNPFPINWLDKCHFEKSLWEAAWYISYSEESKGCCRTCKYNTNRSWADSICDYPVPHDIEK